MFCIEDVIVPDPRLRHQQFELFPERSQLDSRGPRLAFDPLTRDCYTGIGSIK